MVRKVSEVSLEGVGALMVTPSNQDHTLNEDAVRKQIDWCIEKGATSLWPSGYTGQWPDLTLGLRKRYFEVCAGHSSGRAWVAAGCHGTRIDDIVDLINHAEKAGCEVAWVCPIAIRRPTDDEIISQFRYILERTSLPLIVYNHFLMGVCLTAQLMTTILSLSDRIVGIKDSVGDFAHMATLYYAGLGKRVSIFGTTYIMTPHMEMGASGVLAIPWAIPIAAAAYSAFREGNTRRAWELQLRLTNERPLLTMPVLGKIMPGSHVTSSVIGADKLKTSLVTGIDMGPPMPPYAPASEAEIEALKRNIAEFKFLEP